MTGFLEVMSDCPKPEFMNPCNCVNDTIFCGGNELINLKHVFNLLFQELDIRKKHFKKFFLNNTAITELEKNTFYDIVFDKIEIRAANKFKLIDTDVFSETNLITKSFGLFDCPTLNQPPNHDLFRVISKMKYLEYLEFANTEIEEIPSNAFSPVNGYQIKLNYVKIYGSKLIKINENVFYDLDSLTYIDLSPNSIFQIPMNSFQL
jgi:hypothetical protein